MWDYLDSLFGNNGAIHFCWAHILHDRCDGSVQCLHVSLLLVSFVVVCGGATMQRFAFLLHISCLQSIVGVQPDPPPPHLSTLHSNNTVLGCEISTVERKGKKTNKKKQSSRSSWSPRRAARPEDVKHLNHMLKTYSDGNGHRTHRVWNCEYDFDVEKRSCGEQGQQPCLLEDNTL